jgi:hypothetical protein
MGKGNTPEGKVKKAIRKVLDKYPESYWFWPVPYGYGESSIDVLGCHYGAFVGIEAKKPGEDPTPLQREKLRRIDGALGVTFVIDGVDKVGPLETYLQEVKQNATRSSDQPEAQDARRPVRRERREPVPGVEKDNASGFRRTARAAPADRDVHAAAARLQCPSPDPDAL